MADEPTKPPVMPPMGGQRPGCAMVGHFDSLAPGYERYRLLDQAPIDAVVDLVAADDPSICELGCGTGRCLIAIAERLAASGWRRVTACGVDINTEMLHLARQASSERGLTMAWFEGRAEDTGLPEDSMSLIISFQSVHLFAFPDTLLEVERIARPGALFVVYTRLLEHAGEEPWGSYFPGYVERSPALTREFMHGMAHRSGLSLVDTRSFTFRRTASVAWLCEQTRNKLYSTLSKFTESEFEHGYQLFAARVAEASDDDGRLDYTSTHTLFVYRSS